MVFQGWEEHFSEQRVGIEFISQHEREGGGFCGTMRNGVVVEFSCGEKFCPFLGVVGTEDSGGEYLFKCVKGILLQSHPDPGFILSSEEIKGGNDV